MQQDTKRSMFGLIALYAISNFLLLLNRGIYWDSWVWVPLIKEKNYKILWDLLGQGKLYTSYFLFKLAGLSGNPILLFKFFAFISWLLAGLLLYRILRQKFMLRNDRAFFISASFILIPTYLVKIEPSLLQYSINNLFFFLAAFAYFKAEKINSKILAGLVYLASWILFFLSFFTNSFLVFYGGFLLLLFPPYFQNNLKQPFKNIFWDFLKNNLFFILLPVIFWVLKISVWKPAGAYAEYNGFISFKDAPLPLLVMHVWDSIIFGFFWPIVAPIIILSRKIFSLLLLLIGAITYLLTKKIFLQKETDPDAKYYLAAGGILFFLGFLPYFLVGKSPHIPGNVFAMRHALLLPLGSSLIILGMILLAFKEGWQPKAQNFILTLFMVFSIFNYYGLDMDSYKQRSVMESLRTTGYKNIRDASTLVFYDQMPDFNWQNRSIHPEEYKGYVQEIFKKENSKFAVWEGENIAEEYDSYKKFMPNAYPYPANFNPEAKIAKVAITSSAPYEILTVYNWLQLKKYELFYDNPTFKQKLKEILQIEAIPLE